MQIDAARVTPDGLLHVEGWAVAPGITAIQVFFGHRFLGLAELGRPRGDVGAAFAEDPRAAWSGFLLITDVAGEDLSERMVHARAVLAGAPPMRVSTAVEVAALSHPAALPAATIEAGFDHCALMDAGVAVVSGWATSAAGIASIVLSLDDGPPQAAEIGLPRPDIGNRYPRSRGARQSGFAFSGRLTGGPATPLRLLATITATDGRRQVLEHRFGAAAPETAVQGVGRDPANRIKFFIDEPALLGGAARRPVRSSLSLRGWAIGRDGIADVDVAFDGKVLGPAYRGLNRPDIHAAFPDWPGSRRCGFAFNVPPVLLTRGGHRMDLTIRDGAGRQVATGFELEVAADTGPIVTTVLRRAVGQAEIALNRAILERCGASPRFAVLLQLAGGSVGALRQAARTLRTLRAQAYPTFQAVLLLPPGLADEAVQPLVAEFGDLPLRCERAGAALGEQPGCTHVMALRPGDVLGADALMEFAVAACARPTPDLIYADEIRQDRANGRQAADFRPQWSPDLLLSTNYLGRIWCATAALMRAAGASAAELRDHGGFDLVLRVSERAAQVASIPKVLGKTAAADGTRLERNAVRRAVWRRGIAATVEDGLAPGLFRVRRTLQEQPTVSIVMPTNASRDLFRTAIESIRTRTHYAALELVAVDNIGRDNAPAKAWLRAHADRVVAMPGPFNWSRFNNAGARRARGAMLLFLNDDIAVRDPDWLDAMLEQALRPEVGAVGARLLYPDGKVQHAGVHLSLVGGLHSYRFLPGKAAGPFGYAVSLREVTAVTGACLMTRRDVFEAVGGFDTTHAVINNDLDFCLRVRARGLQVVCTPHAVLTHHELGSREALPDRFDSTRFATEWGSELARGDRYVNANLARLSDSLEVQPEPTRVVPVAGPLLAAASVRRILAIKLDHIGDFVTALPAFARLKQRFPSAELHVLCSPACAALARLSPAIDQVIPFAFYHPRSSRGRRRASAAELASLAGTLARRRFDIAIDLRKHPETRFMLRQTGARLLAGFDRDARFDWLDVPVEWDSDRPALRKRRHVSDDLLVLVESVAIACAPGAGDAAQQALRQELGDPVLPPRRPGGAARICVHPAAGSVMKQWPVAYFASLMDLLGEDDAAEFVLVGGPEERSLADRVSRATRHPERVTSLVGRVELEALPQVLRECDLFVGNDSGPKHLAAALGVPTVGIHSGIVDPSEWGPAGRCAVAVYRQMVCSPCYLTKPSACPRGLACLHGLSPGEVAAACRRMLQGIPRSAGSGAAQGDARPALVGGSSAGHAVIPGPAQAAA
jgi:ADP-heptose:LPS heptosyltransferase/GT2 family glycosyltransferase